jgi:hypothetical protein
MNSFKIPKINLPLSFPIQSYDPSQGIDGKRVKHQKGKKEKKTKRNRGVWVGQLG